MRNKVEGLKNVSIRIMDYNIEALKESLGVDTIQKAITILIEKELQK